LRAALAAAGGGAVTFKHVRRHNGDLLNERADELATGAIRRA
jgi:ribonuclease HI